MSSTSFRLPSAMLGLLVASSLGAQMSGTYTIDPNGSGSRNFKDFQNAAYQLFVQGVSGPVVFEIAAGEYKTVRPRDFYLAPVSGASATNTITFKSKVQHAARFLSTIYAQDYGARFPVQWYVFDGLEFVNPKLPSHQQGVWSNGYTNDMEVKNCRFVSTAISVTAGNNSKVQRWSVHHNVFTGGTAASNGACRFYGGQDIDIHHNEFDLDGLGGVAISFSSVESAYVRSRIYNNLIHARSFSSNSVTAQGILAETARALDVYHNTVVVRSVVSGTKPAGNSICLKLGGVFGRESRAGNNILISEDVVHCADYVTTQPYSLFLDGNIYQSQESRSWVVNNQTLSQWQSSSGLDKTSMQTDPQFIGSGSSAAHFALKATSPAIGKAVNTPAYITDDFFGNPRAGKATIGAIEYIPPSTFTPYGSGCAGTGGRVPAIGMSGELKLGSRNFLITLSNAKGGTGSAYFALGLTRASLNFGGRCTLLVSPQLLVLLPISGLSGPGNGSSSLRLPIPNRPGLKGTTAHAQWGVLDSAAAGIGIAFSNAATIKL